MVNDTALVRFGDTYGRSLLPTATGEVLISGYGDNAPHGGSDLFLLQYRGLRPLASATPAPVLASLRLYPNPAGAGRARGALRWSCPPPLGARWCCTMRWAGCWAGR